MRTHFGIHVWKVVFWSMVMLGVVFATSVRGHPASAETGVLQPLSPAAVANDDFDNALVIPTVPYSNTQDIIDATVTVDDPVFSCGVRDQRFNTVWYRYTPSATSNLIFSRDGSQHDTVLAVWSGTRGTLTSESCSTQSQVVVTLTAGTTYHIEIARYAQEILPAPTTMNLVLSIYPADTHPAAFAKTSPANGALYQSTRTTLSWGTSTYAASYAYCYDTTDNDACDASWITTSSKSVSLSGLTKGMTYYWQVRATNAAGDTYADNAWWSFMTASDADTNQWTGTVLGTTRPVSFGVLTDGTLWLDFAVTVPYNGCSSSGTSKITVGGPGAISSRAFSYGSSGSSIRFTGAFGSAATASGSYTLSNYPICVWIAVPGYCCWAYTSGSGLWAAGGPALPGHEIYLPVVTNNHP